MRKFLTITLFALLPFGTAISGNDEVSEEAARHIYEGSGLDRYVDYPVFEKAYEGYSRIDGRKKELLTLIDFSKPSTEERLYVIDMGKGELLYHSLVAHGKGSGDNYATSFGNAPNSHKSSLGFYLTESTYTGRSGYSLVLNGLEKGVNDNARSRGIVMHGADYCDPSMIVTAGRLGRSFGCPALPHSVNAAIIDAIKGGSVLYIYAPDSRSSKG